MDYYIKTRYLTKQKKNIFGKESIQVQLMCLGIVCEDGRELFLTTNSWSHRWISAPTEHYLHDIPNVEEWAKKTEFIEKIGNFCMRNYPEIPNFIYVDEMDFYIFKNLFIDFEPSPNYRTNLVQMINYFISDSPDELFYRSEHSRDDLIKSYIEWNKNNETGNLKNILWRMKEWHKKVIDGKIKAALLNV